MRYNQTATIVLCWFQSIRESVQKLLDHVDKVVFWTIDVWKQNVWCCYHTILFRSLRSRWTSLNDGTSCILMYSLRSSIWYAASVSRLLPSSNHSRLTYSYIQPGECLGTDAYPCRMQDTGIGQYSTFHPWLSRPFITNTKQNKWGEHVSSYLHSPICNMQTKTSRKEIRRLAVQWKRLTAPDPEEVRAVR